MKKILISLIILISLSEAQTNKHNNIKTYPYDLELIIKYIKNKENINKTKFNKTLFFINSITNNKIIKLKIKNIMEKIPYIDTTTYKYALIDDKDLEKDKTDSLYYKLMYQSMSGELNKIMEYPDNKIYKISNKGIIYAIKAFIYKDTNDKKYKKYKKLSKGSLKNELLFYYILYKYSYIYEDYASSLEYIQYIKRVKPYKGIDEDISELCLKGSNKYLKDKDYPKAWILSKEGLKAIQNLGYGRNIDTLLQLKKNLTKSSKKFLEKENKKKDLFLYIIKETENSLKVK
jgi:hypothetical protein